MKKNIIFNTLLNVGLILMIFSAVAAYNSKQYLFLVIAIVIALVLLYGKYLLLKEVRQMTRENKK